MTRLVELKSLQETMKSQIKELNAGLSGVSSANYNRRDHSSVSHAVSKLIATASNTRISIRRSVDRLEKKLAQQSSRFKKTELILTLLTLLMLLIEAGYVFSPAVQRLHDALRIRSDFLSRMSHEIRNPMNSIIGMTNLMLDTPTSDQQRRYLSILKKSSSGLLDMLNSLLDFSSMESGKLTLEKRVFYLKEVLERAMDMSMAAAHANGVELILDLDENVPLQLRGDPLRVFQILSNLIGNAVKFTRQGHVMLKVASATTESNKARITFSVIDTGPGIDSEKLDTIFNPFTQADSSVRRKFGGTGLGLTIAKQLTDLMRGRISVLSEKDKGSTFSFTVDFEVEEYNTVAQQIASRPIKPFEALIIKSPDLMTQIIQRIIGIAGGTSSVIQVADEITKELSDQKAVRIVILDFEDKEAEINTSLPLLAKKGIQFHRVICLLRTTASSQTLERLSRLGLTNILFKPIKPIQFYEALTEATLSREQSGQKMAMKPAAAPSPALPIHPQKKITILVVDDSHDNQNLIKIYLQSTQHRLVFADEGQMALDKFREERFDLVLMDLQMPVMDGYSSTQAIRQWEESSALEATPIIAVSAHDPSHEYEKYAEAGFTARILKPVDPHQLIAVISQYMGHEKPNDKQEKVAPQIQQQIRDLLPGYIENRCQELLTLKEFIAGKDFPSISRIGHRLKGNGAMYGFPQLSEIGAALEIAANDQDFEKTVTLIASIEPILNEAKQNLGESGKISRT